MKITDLQEPNHIQNITGGKYFLKMISVFFIIIVSFLFIFTLNTYSAQECKIINIPTYSRNVENLPQQNPCDCSGASPDIISSSETIAPSSFITMYVDSGYLACPPYTWSTTSNGYSISKSTTDNDLEEITLSATSGSCGSDYEVTVTVTVTDNCGEQVTAKIKNTAGQWGGDSWIVHCGGTGSVNGYAIVGDTRYRVTLGSSTGYEVWNESCGLDAGDSNNYCSRGCANWIAANEGISDACIADAIGAGSRCYTVTGQTTCRIKLTPGAGTAYTMGGFLRAEWECP